MNFFNQLLNIILGLAVSPLFVALSIVSWIIDYNSKSFISDVVKPTWYMISGQLNKI